MQEGALIPFPAFSFLEEPAGQVRDAVEGLLLPVHATLDSFASAVTVLSVWLIIVFHGTLAIIVVLICVSVAVSLHRRSGLWLLDLSENGAEVNTWGWLCWLVIRRAALTDGCHCRIKIKASWGRLRRWLCLHLRLHLSGLLLGSGELGKDGLEAVGRGLTRLLLHLRLYCLRLLSTKKGK